MAKVLLWLNANAAAVQAVASLATLATTAVLAVLTARYVGLTKKLAQAASEQVGLVRDAAEAERAATKDALLALASRMW